MKKLLTAGALAGAIAFTPALAAPAHAGNNEDALLGVGLAVALGTAIVLANDYDDDSHRHYNRSYNRDYNQGHVHTKDCNHGNHNGHVNNRDYKHGHDHDRDYNRGDRHNGHVNNRDNHHDRDYRNGRYDRFDQGDARRIAKNRYNIDVKETIRRDNKIIVKGWDRRDRWTRIAFNARTGEVVNIDKKNRRG